MAVLDKNKLLGKKNGGALAVRPKTNIVPVKGKGSSIEKASPENPTLVIREKVIKIEDILKGTLAVEKKAANDRRKAQEQEKRAKSEQGVESSPKSKEKGIKLAAPRKIKSWWDNIKKFFGTVLFGWLALRLVDWLPKLMPLLKTLGSIAEWLLDAGGVILAGLVNFIDWGYKAVEATETWIGDKFGEDAAAKFESFMTGLTKVMNVVVALGFAAAAMAGMRGPKPKVKKPKGKKPKWQKNLQQKWKKSPLGKRVRNVKANLLKTRRKITQSLKPKNIVKSTWFKNIKGKGARFLQGAGDTLVKVGKGVLNSLPNFNKLGKQLGGALTNAYDVSSTWVKKRYDNVIDISKALKSKWDNALKGAGQAFNNMKAGAQQKIMEKVLQPVMEFLQPLIKKLKGIGGTIMKTLRNIPGFDQIMKVLNKFGGPTSEGLLKKIGGKAIPIIGGVVNMGFAYDRLSKGDSIGGLIEGLSGLLDLSGLIGFAPGPGISMLMDGYMFARDFVPQIQEGEEAAVAKLGLSGFKKNIDDIFSNLPGIGEIAKWITGGEKEDEKTLPEGTGITSVNVADVQKGNNGVDTYASYENGGDEKIYVIKSSSSNTKVSPPPKEKVVTVNLPIGASADPYASTYRG